MIPFEEAMNILRCQLRNRKLPTESVPIQEAIGRVIREDQFSALDIPPFDKSSVDGFAVGDDQGFSQYRILETVAAGDVPFKKLEPGTATKIMTGAPVPEGTVKVIMAENTSETDGRMRIVTPEDAVNIFRKGEDIRRGDKIISAGTVLGVQEIGNLISVGITHVNAACPVRVGIISTGNEIVDDPAQLTAGKIMDTNGPMLVGLCRQYGFEVVSRTHIQDQMDATVSALGKSLEQADMLILSGGVSVGQFDFVTKALEQIGMTIHFNRLCVKPGKPMTFATSDSKVVLGLPGNPVAVFLMFHLFVLTAARQMAGCQTEFRGVRLPLGFNFHRRKADRTGFIPCQLGRDGKLKKVEYHGSAHLRALLDCDGFFIVPKDVSSLSQGQTVDYVILKGAFG